MRVGHRERDRERTKARESESIKPATTRQPHNTHNTHDSFNQQPTDVVRNEDKQRTCARGGKIIDFANFKARASRRARTPNGQLRVRRRDACTC